MHVMHMKTFWAGVVSLEIAAKLKLITKWTAVICKGEIELLRQHDKMLGMPYILEMK